MFEHFSILNYQVQEYDTVEIEKLFLYKNQIKINILLFLVEYMMLFVDQINIAQILDRFDYQARCT